MFTRKLHADVLQSKAAQRVFGQRNIRGERSAC
jgi:hypothetical protein